MVKEQTAVKEQTPVIYKTEALLKSKALGSYQPDFAKLLLTEPEYTLPEAQAVLNAFFRKEQQ